MSAISVKSVDDIDINLLCEVYLNMLDKRQIDVYNIRMLHHEVWKATRPSKLIKHHRAGSRVERQLRLLPTGTKSDVDYKYEVDGVLVDTERGTSNMYYKTSSDPVDGAKAYGIVYATKTKKEKLETDEVYKTIFADAFYFDKEENAYVLIPSKFKERVVEECGMEMRKDPKRTPLTSPAISGYGAMNEYDAVPCLRLSSWPQETVPWKDRISDKSVVFSSDWKNKIYNEESLFIVPTGNPLSSKESSEWRLSFSFIEKRCFDQIHYASYPRMRRLYGILKFVFKKLWEKADILSSYHLKTLFFWKVENWSRDKWQSISTTDFVAELLGEMKHAMDNNVVNHFFIQNCNIFPFHKHAAKKESRRIYDIDDLPKAIEDSIIQVILTDLGVARGSHCLREASAKLETMDMGGAFYSYINAYLTRLLSVCVHSLYENQTKNNFENCLAELRNAFVTYGDDPHVKRIMPILNTVISMYRTSAGILPVAHNIRETDRLCISSFDAFGAYLKSKRHFLNEDGQNKLIRMSNDLGSTIGVTVLKMQVKDLENDPLQYIFQYLSETNDQSRRIYMEPSLLLMYLHMQCFLQQIIDNDQSLENESLKELFRLLEQMNEQVRTLSDRLPHVGKLSYKYIGVLLLRGYKLYLKQNYNIDIPDNIQVKPERLHGLSKFSTNLDIT